MLPSFAKQTITVIRPNTKIDDRDGRTIPDWDNATRHCVVGCSVQPASTSLSQDGRVLGISDSWTAYLPPSADVQAGDRIEFDGQIYTIMGEPRVWTGALNLSNIQLNLTRWEG